MKNYFNISDISEMNYLLNKYKLNYYENNTKQMKKNLKKLLLLFKHEDFKEYINSGINQNVFPTIFDIYHLLRTHDMVLVARSIKIDYQFEDTNSLIDKKIESLYKNTSLENLSLLTKFYNIIIQNVNNNTIIETLKFTKNIETLKLKAFKDKNIDNTILDFFIKNNVIYEIINFHLNNSKIKKLEFSKKNIKLYIEKSFLTDFFYNYVKSEKI